MAASPVVKTVPQAEIKVSLPEGDVRQALSVFGLLMPKAVAREIYFFDTASFALSEAGLVLRARKTAQQSDDVTVKLRPMKRESIGPKWRSLQGLKNEVDIVGKRQVESCSLTQVVRESHIEHVVMGDHPLQGLFTPVQYEFIAQHTKVQTNWPEVQVFGAINARIWKVKARGLAEPLTIELWRLPNNRRLIEFSSKGPLTAAAEIQARIDAFLAAKGFAGMADGDTKTRLAVRFFTGERGPEA
jgi:hypothetical protein